MARQTRMTNRFLADSSELKMIRRTDPAIQWNGLDNKYCGDIVIRRTDPVINDPVIKLNSHEISTLKKILVK